MDVLEQRGQVVLQVARRDVAEREGGRRLDLLRRRAEAGHHGVEQRRVAAQVVGAADLAQAEQREDARLRRPVEPRELAAEALDHGGAQAGVGRVRAADRHRLRERRERVLAHAARGGARARARGGEELGGEGVEAEGGHVLG